MSDWRLDAIGQHDDSPPPPPAGEAGRGDADPSAGRRRLRRGAASAVVAVALAGFGGALWYAYDTYRTQGGAGIAPLIRADLEPTRIKPDQPGGMDVPHRDRLVLQDPAGDPETAADTTVVASAEEPLPPPDDAAVSLVESANAAPLAAATAVEEEGAGADPIGALIAGDGKPDAAAARAGAAPKADAAAVPAGEPVADSPSVGAAPAARADGAIQGAAADAPAVPAVPTGPVQVAQLDQSQTASDAAPALLTPPTEEDAGVATAVTGAGIQPTPAPDGTEALLPRLMQVAQATDGASAGNAGGDAPAADAAAAEDAAEDTAAAEDEAADADSASEDASEGLPEISPTPQLAPATPQAEAAAGVSSPDAAATPVVFAVPLGALNAAAAADLRVAEAIAPAGFDAAAALTAFGTRASGLEQSDQSAAPAADGGQVEATAPTGDADDAAGGTTDGTATQTAAAPAPAAPPATQVPAPQAGGGWRVQLAAVTSEAEAEEEWSRFQARFPALLGSLDLIVPTAMIDGRRWYRVQAGPLDESGARRLCVQLKEQGADCIVRQ